ncbi:MAG: DUF4476 domain-containing protein [Cyanobacteria bacterium P01_F01_bin.86]
MFTRFLGNLHIPCCVAISWGLGCLGGALPAQATPHLSYTSVQDNGSLSTCLNRAETAMFEADLLQESRTLNSISGSDFDLTATIHCQTLNTHSFQAIVIVAGEEDAGLADINSVLNVLSSVVEDSDPDIGWPDIGWPDLDGDAATMDESEFRQFMAALDDSWPDYLEFLAQPVSYNYFTAAQASQIVSAMSFSQEEVQAAVMLYPRVVDLNNWFVVEQALSFEFDRQELRDQIERVYGGY